jgi:CDP-glycerol glycerophosphotransferase
MKISVIIPFYENEAYLRDCLDSLKEQEGQDLEILIICDRVPEKDLYFLKEYELELPIQVYHLKDKTGVAAARNLGLDKATGDYVYFLDSDDYLYGNTLEKLLSAAQESDADIVYGRKKPTWYQRSVFLVMKQEQESENPEEEEEDSASANIGADNDVEEMKESSEEEDSEDDESNEATETNAKKDIETDTDNDTDTDDTDHTRNKDNAAEDDTNTENPTEEELFKLLEARKRTAYRVLVSKRKGLKNISVLNILFKRSFIEEHRIRFPENLIYLSDLPFLIEALAKTEKFKKRLSAKYIKRKHNDAINFPSLSQIKDPNKFYEYLIAYQETMKRIPEDSDIKKHLDRKYITYYVKTYAPRLKRSLDNSWREDKFIRMSELMSNINPEILRKLKGYKRRLIKALIRKDVVKSIRIVKVHLAKKKLKKILLNKKELAKFLYFHIFLKMSVKDNWVIFESFLGKSYSGNPKYIFEYLARKNQNKYRYIWAIDKKNVKIPFHPIKIKRFSIRYYYYLARCKYCVFNSRQPEWMQKREGNIFLQTWHGTPLKKLVFDIEDISSATPRYKQQVYNQSRLWDYLVAPNAFSSETFRRCFMFEKTMLESGYPRNDILHAPDLEAMAGKIRQQLGLPDEKKIILYAPTWRDDEYYAKGQYKFELQLDLQLMMEQLGKEYVILLRTHYFIADSIDVTPYKGFAYNLSKYDDISELYLISDLLITDYSSVFFDYANLRRPMLFFTYDLEKYRDVLRGFYFDIEKEVPGPLLFNTEEVVDAIKNIDKIIIQYQQKYSEFYQRFCSWEDGHASEKVVKSVFEQSK